jgi:hypothetical protein
MFVQVPLSEAGQALPVPAGVDKPCIEIGLGLGVAAVTSRSRRLWRSGARR